MNQLKTGIKGRLLFLRILAIDAKAIAHPSLDAIAILIPHLFLKNLSFPFRPHR